MSARPTVYRGITMRSRLEADFAAWLDNYASYTWRYEPQCFASEAGQYLPDFLITGRTEEHTPVIFPIGAYVEVKPGAALNDELGHASSRALHSILDRMAIIWDSEPDAALCLVVWEYGAREPREQFWCDPCTWWSSCSDGPNRWRPRAYSYRVKARIDRLGIS